MVKMLSELKVLILLSCAKANGWKEKATFWAQCPREVCTIAAASCASACDEIPIKTRQVCLEFCLHAVGRTIQHRGRILYSVPFRPVAEVVSMSRPWSRRVHLDHMPVIMSIWNGLQRDYVIHPLSG
ncbi:hypothetical protein EDB89DRAFT_961321 [Lactarius sanguifluus]|nr:hypothetical protein EDB89DRAFT_961321 [Lactarius sanguifluus]